MGISRVFFLSPGIEDPRQAYPHYRWSGVVLRSLQDLEEDYASKCYAALTTQQVCKSQTSQLVNSRFGERDNLKK